MPQWWDSLDTVSRMQHWLLLALWIFGVFTTIIGLLLLLSGRQASKLQTKKNVLTEERLKTAESSNKKFREELLKTQEQQGEQSAEINALREVMVRLRTGPSPPKLTSNELQQRALEVASLIRQLYSMWSDEQDDFFRRAFGQPKWFEQSLPMDAYYEAMRRLNKRMLLEYNSSFKKTAVFLRDELLGRLHNNMKDKDAFVKYEYPFENERGECYMDVVASDLERLAEALKG